jgi:hypothetical protein
MSNMSRERKPPTEQSKRGGSERKGKTKKVVGKAKTMKRLRRSTRDYSEGKEPAAGTSGTIPIVKDGSAGRYSEDGKSVKWADKPKSEQGLKLKKKKS